MKKLPVISLLVLINLFIVGKGALTAEERFPLPDFSFVLEGDNFDPRNVYGQKPHNLAEAKRTLKEVFYLGLFYALKNRQLPIVAETIRRIEKILDLTSKVLGFPKKIFARFGGCLAVVPSTLKDFLEKLTRLPNRQATTIFTNSPIYQFTISLFHQFTISLFSLSLLSLSTIVLRL